MLQFNEPYDRPAEPQQIREDFAELAAMDGGNLLQALANYLPTDTLADFIDDRLMDRV